MKLRKDKWETVKIGDVCETSSGGTPLRQRFDFYGGNIPWIKSGELHSKFVKDSEEKITETGLKNSSAKLFPINTILIALYGVTAGISAILKIPAATNQAVCGIIPIDDKVYHEFLYTVLTFKKEDIFKKRVGTYQLNISQSVIRNTEIPLPPLEEQKQIAALFQSIETAMEQVEGQERNLKALWKRLVDEFVSEKPCFGNLLTDKKLDAYNYCDVTNKLMRKINPLTFGIDRIVAGENLESEDFKIRTWQKVGEGYLGPAFHVLFKSGDILYGSRRTYLRKVSLADFDGVCANTTYVIRANEKILLQDLLKHIMLSERFTQYSIGVSKGSTNPYINWSDLDNFSFQIPELDTQKEIVKILDSILEIVEQFKQQKTTLKQLKQKLLNEILG
jgi:restriction endonuclease S subunit